MSDATAPDTEVAPRLSGETRALLIQQVTNTLVDQTAAHGVIGWAEQVVDDLTPMLVSIDANARAWGATYQADRGYLTRVQERLQRADRNLQTLRTEAYPAGEDPGNPEEVARLNGKIEGVRLAQSYVAEDLR